MTKIKKIPCRICGKLFKPCGYCQENAGVFRWRNFACSRECAKKYFNDTIAFRNIKEKNSDQILMKSEKDISYNSEVQENFDKDEVQSTTSRKKYKKSSNEKKTE